MTSRPLSIIVKIDKFKNLKSIILHIDEEAKDEDIEKAKDIKNITGVKYLKDFVILKLENIDKVEDAENKTEEVINTASELLDQYSSEFAYASDPIGKTYHKYSCPKLTDHYYYDTVNNWKNRGLKKCKLCYAAGWDMYLAVSLADGE